MEAHCIHFKREFYNCKKMKLPILLLSTLLCLTIRPVSGCQPCYVHPQTRFCRNDLVFKGRVLSRDPEEDDRFKAALIDKDRMYEYKIRVLKTFKGPTHFEKRHKPVTVRHAIEWTLSCVPVLSVNTIYLLSVSSKAPGNYTLPLCSMHWEWKGLPRYIKASLFQGHYKGNCKCKVDYRRYVLLRIFVDLCKPIGCCVLGEGTDNLSTCYLKTYCVKRAGKCVWWKNYKDDCEAESSFQYLM